LVNTCKTYTVSQNDTCDGIAITNDISTTQFLAWNPIINAGCNNLYSSVGYEICVSLPGTLYNPPNITGLAPVGPAATPVPVPRNADPDSNQLCGLWYNVTEGDYCNLLTVRFGISLQDFKFLNPDINDNCTNLYLNESYCVLPVGSISRLAINQSINPRSPNLIDWIF
jgi:LysM domain